MDAPFSRSEYQLAGFLILEPTEEQRCQHPAGPRRAQWQSVRTRELMEAALELARTTGQPVAAPHRLAPVVAHPTDRIEDVAARWRSHARALAPKL